MILVAIDPGLKTGIAIFKNGKLIHNTNVASKTTRPFKLYIDKVRAVIGLFVEKHQDMKVIVEETFYRYKGINSTHHKTLGIYEYFFDCEYIAPATVKKILTTNGRASKEEVKDAVLAKLSDYERAFVIQESEDAVDAVAIGLAYMEKNK